MAPDEGGGGGGGGVIKFKSLKFLGVLPSTRAALRLPSGSAGT